VASIPSTAKRKATDINSATRNKIEAASAELPYVEPKVALRVAITGIPMPVASMRHEKKNGCAIRGASH
jgi:hypothetical protein